MDKGLAKQLQRAIEILGDGYRARSSTEYGLGSAGNLALLAAGAMENGRVNAEITKVWGEIGSKLKQIQSEIGNAIGGLYTALQAYSLEQLASQQETLEAGNEMLNLLSSLDQEEQEVEEAKMYQSQATPVTVQIEP